jgi:hypothetical protein
MVLKFFVSIDIIFNKFAKKFGYGIYIKVFFLELDLNFKI